MDVFLGGWRTGQLLFWMKFRERKLLIFVLLEGPLQECFWMTSRTKAGGPSLSFLQTLTNRRSIIARSAAADQLFTWADGLQPELSGRLLRPITQVSISIHSVRPSLIFVTHKSLQQAYKSNLLPHLRQYIPQATVSPVIRRAAAIAVAQNCWRSAPK